MTRSLRIAAVCLLLLAATSVASDRRKPAPADHHSADYRSMQQKLDYLKENAARATPDPKPMELTAAEVNAYFKEGGVKLPKGVTELHLTSQPAVIDATAKIDFDLLTEKARSSNPLMAIFSGMHQVRIVAQAAGAAGTGSIRAQSVYLDGTQIPPMLVDLFVSHYVTSKYAHVGTTTTFALPFRIRTAIVDTDKVRLFQR